MLGVKWYWKPYYFGNAGYAFPYLLEATNIVAVSGETQLLLATGL